jgi:3-phosphoshikimate 1-carboxyvinyltransferase
MSFIKVASKGPMEGRIKAPSSKSYTQRAMIAAALSYGRSEVVNPSSSDDSITMRRALELYGIEIEGSRDVWRVRGREPLPPSDIVNCGLSGATIRFLTSFSAQTAHGYSVLTGEEGLRRRPMGPLLDAINGLGGWAISSQGNGLPPIIVRGGKLKGGMVKMSGALSSQFVSSVLLASPASMNETEIEVERLVSKPYVDMTLAVMKGFGADVERDGYTRFVVRPSGYRPSRFKVPGDFSSASFFLVGAALTEGRVMIEGLDVSLPQADSKVIDVLKEIGAEIRMGENEVEVKGTGTITGGKFDLTDSPDLMPVVAILGLKAPIEIRGVAHVRVKESDRLLAMAAELKKLGADVKETDDGIKVAPSKLVEEVKLSGWKDHRIVMALTIASHVLGLKATIGDAESVSKSYPEFFDHFKALGGNIEWVG